MKTLKDHLDFLNDTDEHIKNSRFEELLQFTNFSLCKLMNRGLVPILLNSDKTIIKHVHFETFNRNILSKNEKESLKTAWIVVIFEYTYKDRVTNRYKYLKVPVFLKNSE